MSAFDSLELRLTEAYRLQAKHYEKALQIVAEQAHTLELVGWANDLQTELHLVATMEERMAADKLAWKTSAQTPGIELRGALERVAEQIRALASAIDRRSQELVAKKQRLLPVMDEFIRHRHMLHSYEQFGKTK